MLNSGISFAISEFFRNFAPTIKKIKIMMFNNKFNKDNTIHFDVEEWSCTDPDTMQFCRKVSDTIFEYIQLKVEDLCRFATSFHLNNKHLLATLNDRTNISDWYQDEIDVTDYDSDEIGEFLSPYGGILDNVNEESMRNQLVCECIFETNIISGEYE